MDLYNVLGLSPKCTQEQARKAYKTLALKLHPDKTNGVSSEEFKRVNEAYQILKDPEKRKLYDQINSHTTDGSCDDVLNVLLNFVLNFIRQRQLLKKDLRLKVNLDLLEVYKGETKKLTVSTRKLSGETVAKNIYIPLVDLQTSYTFEGHGDEYLPGQFSNIVIDVVVAEHPFVKRDRIVCEQDLFIEYGMTLYEYYNGVKRSITHLDGEVFDIECKRVSGEHSSICEYSMVHVLKGKGLPYTEESLCVIMRGDLYVHFRLELPKDVSEEVNDILKHNFN